MDNILYRDHSITSNASRDAAKIFIDSAVFAKIIDSQNTFILNNPTQETEVEDEPTSVYIVDEKKYKEKPKQYLDMVPYDGEEEFVNISGGRNQTFSFALTGGQFAQLVVPTELKPKDIQIIRKQIELLELQVEEA